MTQMSNRRRRGGDRLRHWEVQLERRIKCCPLQPAHQLLYKCFSISMRFFYSLFFRPMLFRRALSFLVDVVHYLWIFISYSVREKIELSWIAVNRPWQPSAALQCGDRQQQPADDHLFLSERVTHPAATPIRFHVNQETLRLTISSGPFLALASINNCFYDSDEKKNPISYLIIIYSFFLLVNASSSAAERTYRTAWRRIPGTCWLGNASNRLHDRTGPDRRMSHSLAHLVCPCATPAPTSCEHNGT